MAKFPMTLEGKRALEEERKRLRSVERPKVVKAIEVARAHGDLSENADYSAAKEQQGFIEGRIQEINGKLADCEAIDVANIKSDKIVFGATVVLEDQESGNKVTYKIVGVDEANVKKGKVAVTSPIARALIGKSAGDEAVVNAPKGDVQYDILEIHFK